MTKEFRNTKDNLEEKEVFLDTFPLGVLACCMEEAEFRSQHKAGRTGKRRQRERAFQVREDIMGKGMKRDACTIRNVYHSGRSARLKHGNQ